MDSLHWLLYPSRMALCCQRFGYATVAMDWI
jgi:hypothetical protein